MSKTLQQIKTPIEEELKHFNEVFRKSMETKVPLLNKITYFLIKRKGKQMRPLFVLLSAKMLGEINENTYRAASLIELMHTATLVHDDVVDDAHRRRGFFSINALWKNKIAVLVGDYLLSRSLILAIDNNDFDQLRNLSAAVKAMSEGELLQIEKARKLDITEEIYFEIIEAKTASLIQSAVRAGALSVTNDKELINKMGEIGRMIGIAFQLKDDLLDYGIDDIGKPRGIDIKEQKMTLPLIHVLQKVNHATKKKLIKLVRQSDKKKENVHTVIHIVKEHGGIEYATSLMKQYKETAHQLLCDIPSSEAKESFIQLIEFTINRKK